MIWKKMIAQGSQQPGMPGQGMPPMQMTPGTEPEMQTPADQGAGLDNFLKFRAVYDGYRLLAQKEAQAQMMAQAPPPEAQPQVQNPPNPPNPANPAENQGSA